MSNFSNVGKRKASNKDRRKVKRHMKRMYAIMDELDEVAKAIYVSAVEWNEDNIAEVAAEHTNLIIDGMEKFLLLGKLTQVKEAHEARNNTK